MALDSSSSSSDVSLVSCDDEVVTTVVVEELSGLSELTLIELDVTPYLNRTAYSSIILIC